MPCIVIYVCFVQGRMPLVPFIDRTPMQSLDSTLLIPDSHSASHAHQLYTSQTQSSSEISLGLWIKYMFVSPLWMVLLGLCYTNVAKKTNKQQQPFA